MIKKLVLIFSPLITSIIITAPVELPFTEPLTIIGNANKTTFFLQDDLRNDFVLKYHPRGPKRAIHDTLGAYVGKSIGININEVEIFSPDHHLTKSFSETSPLQHLKTGIITVHSRVPGVAIKEIKNMNDEIWIKQGLCKEKNLQSIAHYKDLCDIVAFDLFIDNPDRHNRNLFFDTKTGQFYVIDMDHAFQRAHVLTNSAYDYDFDTLATRARDFLKTLKKRHLSSQEIKALKRVRKTLLVLVQRNPAMQLFDEWMNIAEKADHIYSSREQEKIKKYLVHNENEVKRLLVQLDSIINLQATNSKKI